MIRPCRTMFGLKASVTLRVWLDWVVVPHEVNARNTITSKSHRSRLTISVIEAQDNPGSARDCRVLRALEYSRPPNPSVHPSPIRLGWARLARSPPDGSPMDEWSEEDEFFAKPEGFQQLYSDAIALVLLDVDAILGPGQVTHVVDHDEEAFLGEIGPDVERAPGYLMILGRPGGGFSWTSNMTWPDYVVSGAKSIQQSLMEDDYYSGKRFPPCPVHANHPLNPEVVNAKACWTCPRRSIEPIEIGHLAVSGGSERDR
jgi:hypothetical protein